MILNFCKNFRRSAAGDSKQLKWPIITFVKLKITTNPLIAADGGIIHFIRNTCMTGGKFRWRRCMKDKMRGWTL